MVSAALSRLLERARVRFGIEIEILDAGLNNVYPEGGTNLGRMIKTSPTVRRTLIDALAGGRPDRLEDGVAHYRVYPLKRSSARRQATGLLAVRRGASDAALEPDAEPWTDLAKAAVETDLASADTLGEERNRSRQLSAALRFGEYIMQTEDEAALAQSLVQAAAVWFDVDARVYRRSLSHDFVLDSWLPGVKPEPSARLLSSRLVEMGLDPERLAPAADWGDIGARHDALLVPMAANDRTDWVLAIVGQVSPAAELVLRFVARVAGTQFSVLASRRAEQTRAELEAMLADTSKAPELIAVRFVHGLAQAVKAASASLTLTRNGHTRRIAAVGQAMADPIGGFATRAYAPDRLACTLSLGASDQAVLELSAVPGHEFSMDAALVTDACAPVLRTWLSGTLVLFDASAAVLDVAAASRSTFAVRIQEELERARRFDLCLSLILIDVTGPSDAMAQLQDALRRELRGSDVTGAMGGTQVVALLTHTDSPGLDNVVRRLRQRLADTAERLNVSDLRLGQAAFSPEVRTADALLDLALRQAEPVVVH